MKAIMVMFDSLNRHMLPPYGCEWVHAPNFERLAERTVTFENYYVGSMPCMPARRDLHTGRYNFLHRSWGPLEPFDDSMPQLLKEHDVYTHLVTDHYHYWEDGGATYHNRYSSFEIARGQEGDLWKGQVQDPAIPPVVPNARAGTPWWRQDWVNRGYMPTAQDQSLAKIFELGLEFIQTNHSQDNWFLQIESFDPHEPFFTQQTYKDLYPHDYNGPHFDWPNYEQVAETPEQVKHLRYQYAALLSMCDEYLGRVLDMMDELDMWADTMLIVVTDHGFLLGEHDWWAKCVQPFYGEVAHPPLFIWDPRCGCRNERRRSLAQMIDLSATLLDYFGVGRPPDMRGLPLQETIAADRPVHEAVLFGQHGMHVNCTDGRYVYMRAPVHPDNSPLYDYTLMPTHMRQPFGIDELQDIQLAPPFSFSKGCRLMKIATRPWQNPYPFGTLLFDLHNDPKQEHPLDAPAVEERMNQYLVKLMKEHDAPPEQFERLGLG
ncbi:MAG: sulfatase [Anaerolineae bacterium]|nr:sulfatase [Anaerolineae bacterium]